MAAPVYKQSASIRTAFYVLITALFLLISPVMAADPAYTVEGVEVDVTAKNAVMAREEALVEAQVKAYQILAERFLSPEELSRVQAPDANAVFDMVQDFEVTNEQLSATRYKGTYTIRFRPTVFQNKMAAQGKDVSGGIPKPVLVLPVYESAGATSLWIETNPWMAAWRELPTDRSMMQPTVVPLGDAQDMAYLGDSDGLRYDPMNAQQLASKYGAEDVAILLASTAPTATAQGQLIVNIYNNGFEGPRFVQKVTFDQLPGETDAALMSRAATRVKFMLRENWKANAAYFPQAAPANPARQPLRPSAAPISPYGAPVVPAQPSVPVPYTRPALGATQTYLASARFSSAQEWVRMKNILDKTYGMQSVMVRGLKPREAVLELRYAGNATALQTSLQNAGIGMRVVQSGGVPMELYFNTPSQPAYR